MSEYREDLFKNYFDSIFSRSNIFSVEEYEKACNFFTLNYNKFLPEDRNAKILDIGCGTGHFLYFLKKKGFKNFLGVDISSQQIEFCRKKISKKVEICNVFKFLQDKKNLYEVIVANDFLEHIPKSMVVEFLKLVRLCLKENGVFLMKTGNIGNIFGIYLRYKDFTHEAGFTDKSLYQVLCSADFSQIQVKGTIRKDRILLKILVKIIHFFLKKLYWYQGFVAPEILTSGLVGIAKK